MSNIERFDVAETVTPQTFETLADRARVAVIVKCIELNYIESGKYADLPPKEILAIMATSIYNQCKGISTRAMRRWFQEVAQWKAENGRSPIVGLQDLSCAHTKWSDSYVSVPKGDPELPAPQDTILATLPIVVQLRDEKRRMLLTGQKAIEA